MAVTTDKGVFAAVSWENPPGSAFGATVASTTNLTTLNAPVMYVSGTSAISTIAVPFTGFIGELRLIPTGAWTTTTNGNIANVITAAANVPVIAIYNGTSWYMMNGK